MAKIDIGSTPSVTPTVQQLADTAKALRSTVPPLRRSSLVRVASFGDSTANIGTNEWNLDNLTGTFPASGATSVSCYSTKWQTHLYYPRMKTVANGGISGQTTTQMLARDAASSSTTRKAITDILAAQPHVVLLRGGSINDLLSINSAGVSAAVATAYANHVEIINRLLSGVDVVIDSGIFGFTNGSGNTATDQTSTRAALLQLNTLFKTFAAANPGRVYFLDPVDIGLSDSTGAYLTNMSNDGTHLSFNGARLHAKAEAQLLEWIFGPSIGARFEGANLIANPLMANTGAQSWGTLATGFGVTVANATRQNGKIEVIDGKKFQTVEIVPTGTGVVAQINMPFDPTTMGIAANDIFGFEYDFMIDGVTNTFTPVLSQLISRVDLYKSAAGRLIFDGLVPNTVPIAAMDNGLLRGHVQVGPIKFPEASSSMTTSSVFNFYVGTDEQSTFKIGVANPRIVKLNQAQVTM